MPCWRRGNAARRMAREIGASAAPPTPWPTRKTMSHSMLGAMPQSSENSVNTRMPNQTKTRFCPNLSEIRPMLRKRTASVRL